MREALAILRPEQTTKRRCVQSIFQYVEYMRQKPTTAIPTSARSGAPEDPRRAGRARAVIFCPYR